MVRKKIRSLIERLIVQERSPHKLALTCALGTFIAISPLIGAHTIMTFLFSWMLSLSIPAVFMVSVFINNPWTMVPIYSFDHFFGKWLFTVLDIDHVSWDPAWSEQFNLFLEQHIGIGGLSLSAFLIGGNLLAIVISAMLYIPMKRIFRRVCVKKNIDDKIDV